MGLRAVTVVRHPVLWVLLVLIALTIAWDAIGAPVSPVGVVVMVLLAYTIFTTTLVLQRKEASRGLALGLASLTVPLAPYLLLTGLPIQAAVVAAFALILFRGLLSPRVRAYLSEP